MADMNILIIFNTTREIFPNVILVSRILLTTAVTIASVEKANSKVRVA